MRTTFICVLLSGLRISLCHYHILICFYSRQAITSRGNTQLSSIARRAHYTLVSIVLQRYYLGNKPLTLALWRGRRTVPVRGGGAGRSPSRWEREQGMQAEGDVVWRYKYNCKTKP